jgi:hypothetical protein
VSREEVEIARDGCLVKPGYTAATFIVLAAIQATAGIAASAWFAGGFLVAALIAFWESGARKSGPSPSSNRSPHDDGE